MITQLIKKHFELNEKQEDFFNYYHTVIDNKKSYEIITELCILRLDFSSVCAFLLDEINEVYELEIAKIEQLFGKEITELFCNLQSIKTLRATSQKEEAENLRKMLVAMSKDLRVLVIRLYDLMHELKDITLPLTKENHKIIIEVKEIFAPLAERLGLNSIKSEMEDLCLKLLEPKIYDELKNNVNLKKDENQKQITITRAKLENILKELGISGKITARQKNYSSIYNKMKNKNVPLTKIYDLIALRVIVNTVEECYAVFGKVHSIYKPIPQRVKDYIATPKANGYQSLHTSVVAENNRPLEIQIRTQKMHKESEYGVAAHWLYKEKTEKSSFDARFGWIREMMETAKNMSSKEFIQTLKINLYSGSTFVQTPKGKILEFPDGACIIDFAYAIHSEIGNSCVGGKINNKIKPLDTKLQNGDIVEILTSPRAKGPSRDWLNIVKTSNARQGIKAYFKDELTEENIKNGKSILVEAIKDKPYSFEMIFIDKYLEEIYDKFYIANLDELYAAVGHGSITSKTVISSLIHEHEKTLLKHKHNDNNQTKINHNKSGVIVDGANGLLVHFAKCCNALVGDEIVGYISRGKDITIHRKDCKNLKYLQKKRIVNAVWEKDNSQVYLATLKIVAEDCPNLFSQIIKEVDDSTVRSIDTNTKGRKTIVSLKIEVSSRKALQNMIKKFKQIKGVVEVYR